MPVKLYKMNLSPPARAAMMACQIFTVPVELIDVDLSKEEHRTPEYLKKNPVHSVPVLEDGDLIINDSHAILMYLADTYGKSDSMYPYEIKQRALVNQKLFFETAILFPRVRNITYPAIMEGQRKVSQKQLDEIVEAYDFLEAFLTENTFISGNNITIADVSVIATVTSLVSIVPLDVKKYPKTDAWIKEMEKQPFCKEFNEPGAKELDYLIKNLVDL